VSADLAYAVAGVRRDAMPESLFPISNSDDALAVSIPRYVVDATGDDVVLSFGCLRALCVPHSNTAADIARCYVEAGRRELGNSGGRSMLCILLRSGGIVDGADKDGLVRGVGYAFALRVGTEGCR